MISGLMEIGKWHFDWGAYSPSFLVALFQENDVSENLSPDNVKRVGFGTTAEKALANLSAKGYDDDFFAEVYDAFYDAIDEQYRSDAADGTHFGYLDPRAVMRKDHSSLQRRRDDIRIFVTVLKQMLADEHEYEFFTTKVTLGYIITHDSPAGEGPNFIVGFRRNELPPEYIKVSYLFTSNILHEYPEVIGLTITWLALKATDGGAQIFWDMTDQADDSAEAGSLHRDAVSSLSHKVHLYGRAFSVLIAAEGTIRLQVARSRVRGLLLRLADGMQSSQKGMLLEECVASIFEAEPDLPVVQRRYSEGDQEIDLIIKNNVPRTFWTSLATPLILCECKNWHEPVSSRHIRDFEVKIQNHEPLIKLGLFVAPGGFSRECRTEIRRGSRSAYTILPISEEELRRFVESDLTVPGWLEEIICRPV